MRRFLVPRVADWARKVAGSGWSPDNGRLATEFSVVADRHRRLCSTAGGVEEKIVASVVLERLPVVLPLLNCHVSAFRQFSFQWQQQYRRHYPQEFLEASANRGEFDESAAFEPGPIVTEADRTDDRRSPLNLILPLSWSQGERALKKRLYLIVYGVPSGEAGGEAVWHFPEKLYAKEPSLRQCAEAAIGSLVGDLSKSVYFVGNAPCGHLPSHTPALTRFFFRSQLLVSELHFETRKFSDFAWTSKDEIPLYFEKNEAEFLQDMLQ